MSDVTKWWSTEIIDMKPGSINLRGKPIEDLIGKKSFVEMIWFMTTGEEIDSNKLFLLEAALVSYVDHGPQAPSISSPLVTRRVVINPLLNKCFLNTSIFLSFERL